MDTVSLMGRSFDDGKANPKRWRMVPRFLRRFRKRRSSKDSTRSSVHSHRGDQTTVAPSHSTVSRLDDSYDSRDVKLGHTSSDHLFEDEIVFEEESSSFAQQSLNTFAPSAFYMAHSDGMEVILKNGVLSDATVYSWSPTPEDDNCDDLNHLNPTKSAALPIEEICFFPDDDHYSTLIDGDQRDTIFSSFEPGSVKVDAVFSKEDRQSFRHDTSTNVPLGSLFQTVQHTSTYVRNTEQSKPTAAMIKRMSAFTGEDLLRQEAETFAKLFLEDEKSKGPKPNPQVRSSEARLLAAIDAISDDDDTISKERSFFFQKSLMDDGDNDEDGTISTVTGSNIYPAKSETVLATIPEVSSNQYCGLFFSEPITMTEVDGEVDEDYDDFSDLYSRPSTAGSSSLSMTRR